MPFNRGNIQNLVIPIQERLLRHVEERLELFEVDVLASFENFST